MTTPHSTWSILRRRGAIDGSGEQTRLVNRGDLQEVIEANEGSVQYLDFAGLDFTGADIRGLDLSRAHFPRCNFSKVHAGPLIKMRDKELDPHDLATQGILDRWVNQQLDLGEEEVQPTRMAESFLTSAKLDGARFAYADMQGTIFNGSHAEGTDFLKADLRGAIFRFAQFVDVDLSNADLRDADLYRFRLDTNFLDGVDWGDKHIVSHEKKGEWGYAIDVYVMLGRVHELAGMGGIAGEFRYRREQVRSARILDKGLSRAKAPGEQGTACRWLSAVRHGGGWTLVRWLGRWIVNFTFGYGEREWRVVRAILLTLLVFTLVYFDYSPIEFSTDGLGNLMQRAVQAGYFSAISSTALGYGPWVGQDLGWVKYLGAAQSFLGTFLTALFLVTFTRRWMR